MGGGWGGRRIGEGGDRNADENDQGEEKKEEEGGRVKRKKRGKVNGISNLGGRPRSSFRVRLRLVYLLLEPRDHVLASLEHPVSHVAVARGLRAEEAAVPVRGLAGHLSPPGGAAEVAPPAALH